MEAHDDVRIDNYYWLRDDTRKNKDVIRYLNEENKYTEFWFKANKVNTDKIYNYYKNAIPNFEEGIRAKIR